MNIFPGPKLKVCDHRGKIQNIQIKDLKCRSFELYMEKNLTQFQFIQSTVCEWNFSSRWERNNDDMEKPTTQACIKLSRKIVTVNHVMNAQQSKLVQKYG
jgi:hypothetical protein